MSDSAVRVANRRVLCVDLDGTLVRTDLLLESLLSLLRSRPACIFLLPVWLWHGKAYLKAQIASRVDFSAARLPLNADVVTYIQSARASGSYVVLVTGSHQSLADAVAGGAAAGMFDEVQGSSGELNLTGVRKRDWLVERFGTKGFDYIGNDTDDLKVWPHADKALAVSSSDGVVVDTATVFDTVFDLPKITWRDFLSLIRIHQWSKNTLVFVPYVLGDPFADIRATGAIFCAFLAMSLLASATYIVNDMLDLQSDRQNMTKSKRVLASGCVSLWTGLKVAAGLVAALVLLLFFLPIGFNLVLGLYTITTLVYSFALKEKAMVDVIVLAALHTIRVVAGTLAIAAAWSFWLLAFSMFLFFSLALVKRVAELINLAREGRTISVGREYSVSDIPVLQAMGVAAGFVSVLVVALYINDDRIAEKYHQPMLLWLICPVLFYWIGRVWLMTSRGLMHEDPIVFVMRDGISRVAVLIMFSVVALATYI